MIHERVFKHYGEVLGTEVYKYWDPMEKIRLTEVRTFYKLENGEWSMEFAWDSLREIELEFSMEYIRDDVIYYKSSRVVRDERYKHDEF